MKPEDSENFSVTDWLPYAGGIFAGTGASVFATGLFVVKNPDDMFLYVAVAFFALGIICFALYYATKARRLRP